MEDVYKLFVHGELWTGGYHYNGFWSVEWSVFADSTIVVADNGDLFLKSLYAVHNTDGKIRMSGCRLHPS